MASLATMVESSSGAGMLPQECRNRLTPPPGKYRPAPRPGGVVRQRRLSASSASEFGMASTAASSGQVSPRLSRARSASSSADGRTSMARSGAPTLRQLSGRRSRRAALSTRSSRASRFAGRGCRRGSSRPSGAQSASSGPLLSGHLPQVSASRGGSSGSPPVQSSYWQVVDVVGVERPPGGVLDPCPR